MCSVSVLVHVSSYPPPPDAASWCTACVSCVCELPPTPRAQSSPPFTHYTTTIRRFHTLQDGTLFPRLAIVQKLLTWQLSIIFEWCYILLLTLQPYNADWWIGRVVGRVVGHETRMTFVPSEAKLMSVRSDAGDECVKVYQQAPVMRPLVLLGPTSKESEVCGVGVWYV